MKIHVLESYMKYGGRMITMISGFADYFSELGHDVTVFNLGGDPVFKSVESMLAHHTAPHLDPINFAHTPVPQEITLNSPIVDCDLMVFPHPGVSNRVQDYLPCEVASFFIAPPARWKPHFIDRIWVNNYTNREKFDTTDGVIIYDPHDYSSYREHSTQWSERGIDILSVTSITKRNTTTYTLSGEVHELQWLHDQGLRVLGIFIVRNREEEKLLKDVTFPYYANLPRKYIPGFMGNSKILLHQSPLESGALVIYEGMNAGCYPVVREAGACREQMGDVGVVYTEFCEAYGAISDILEHGWDESVSQEQGLKFDRLNSFNLLGELNDIC